MMKKLILLSAAAAALVATPTLAQQGRGPERGAGVTRAEVQTRVRDMFARVDANRDGFLTQAEAQAFRGGARGERRDNRGQRSEARFARLDANRDGSISRDEFFARAERADRAEGDERRGLRAERRGQRGGMMARLGGKRFERIDADKDGRISLAEVTTQRLRAFDRADANRDGRLTREERQAVRAERQARRG